MAAIRNSQEFVDWDALELQAFNLKFEPISTEELVQKARELAATFKKYNEPLPRILERIPDVTVANDRSLEPCNPE